MKKLFFSFLVMLLMASVVCATSTPLPILGVITDQGNPVEGLQVKIKNVQTGVSEMAVTDSSGRYQVEWSNIDQRWVSGQEIQVIIPYCESQPSCVKSAIISGGHVRIDWDASGIELPDTVIVDPVECPECEKCVEKVCPEPVPEESDSLWYYISGLIGLAAGGIGGFFVKKKEAMHKGVGLKIYTKRDGSEGVLHKHPGIKGYHDPKVRHREECERHPKGELTPKYEKDEDGIWEYVG